MDVKEIDSQVMGWIQVTQDRTAWGSCRHGIAASGSIKGWKLLTN